MRKSSLPAIRKMGTRTPRVNALRGFLRELGLHVPVGARTGLEAMGRAVTDDQSPIPVLLRPIMQQLLDEIRLLETRVAQLERQLARVTREAPACKLLMSIRGVGLLTATGILATTSGSVAHFKRIYDCKRSRSPLTSNSSCPWEGVHIRKLGDLRVEGESPPPVTQ